MRLDTKAALQQIDEALNARGEARKRSRFDDLSDLKEGLAELVTVLADAIDRFAPLGSTYREKAALLTGDHRMQNLHLQQEVLSLDRYISTGIGYAHPISRLAAYLNRHPLGP